MNNKEIKEDNDTVRTKIFCTNCNKDKEISKFYKSYGMTASGLLPYCSDCCKAMSLDNNGNIDIEKFKNMLQKVDRPYIHSLFLNNIKKYENPNRIIGFYFKDIGMKQNRNLKYKDSIFENESISDFDGLNNLSESFYLSKKEKNKLVDKWGFGYSDEELYSFEKKYKLLKNNYPEKTAMHTEALMIYIRYRVKEELATSKGDVGEATKWGQLADKASERAKINPSQLSKADLSGGLTGFGELTRSVEQAVDIISILPKFREKPQDKVDFTLWCYINYIRRMKNLPDAEYKEIYSFYEERKEQYKTEKDRVFKFEDE